MRIDLTAARRLKRRLGVLLLATLPFATLAAAAPPDSGAILQQIQPVIPPAPSSTDTGLTIPQENGAALPAGAPLLVKTLRITGNEKIGTAILHALVADAEGKSLTLRDLEKLADRITDYYQTHGYPLARAIVPAQTIHDGVVQIEIIEARYGEIKLDNHSRVNDPLLQATLAPLRSGQAIAGTELDQALLLLSDIPGVAVNATLQPGDAVGTSDLVVAATSGEAVTGNVALDNYGNRYTGDARLGGTVNFIDPLRHGDELSLTGLSSGSDMNYARLGYDAVLNGMGTVLGSAYSALDYKLGDTLRALDGHGTATVASLWAKDPLLRSRDFNLYAQVGFDRTELRDNIGASDISTYRHLDTWTPTVTGDARDGFLGGGIDTWSIGWTFGRLGFDNSQAQVADAGSARTEGRFSKWNVSLDRVQLLNATTTLYLAFSGQVAHDNLDSAEKMNIGGPYTVRAYEMGAISADTGYLGTIEVRHDLALSANAQWQTVVFLDSAHMTINQSPWVAGNNGATLSGVGAGVNWTGPHRWHARVYVATPIGPAPALVGATSSTHVWAEIGKSL
jgi:hemolysin activation/secretion protein